MTLWADKSTDRYLTITAPPASVHPAPPGEETTGLLNPVPTAWFQSINSFAIIILGPIFAWLWSWLEERKRNPSIPLKMVFGLAFMSLGLVVMVFAGQREDRPSSTALPSVPSAIALDPGGRLCAREDGGLKAFHAGRLRFDASKRTLEMSGVLPDIERDRMARLTAPADFAAKLKELLAKSESAAAPVNVFVRLDSEPPGFDLRYAGIPTKELSYDPRTHELKAARRLADRDEKAILVAAADPVFRAALDDLYVRSSAFRVSAWWLFWFYIFSTFGELCLSPVGLSMVSKLAPARFATMLMGLWFLMTFIGTFCAGAGGEIWGTVAPIPYFAGFAVVLAGAAVALLLFVPRIRAMMHGAK
jgi:POT family proton-dependent oligopeptide transporter